MKYFYLFFVVILCFFGKVQQIAAEQNTQQNIQQNTQIDALSVKGSQLVNTQGDAVQLKGISTHGIAWFPNYINENCFQELKQHWGINVVRVAMYTAENGGYCTDGDKQHLKNLIKNAVEYAEKCNLYIIIDWHILSDGNPNTYKEEAKAFFDEISKAYGNKNNIIYEICNEPNGSTSWQEIKQYAEEIIEVIRKNDADNIILVGTPNWSQFVEQAAENPIVGQKNIMYTLHFYAATHRQDLRNAMIKAISSGLPIFVSEYGICDASGNGAIDTIEAKEWIDTMNRYCISYVAWNLSNKAETSAILKSDCQKSSNFTQQDLSDSGKWLYTMLSHKTALPQNSEQISKQTPPKSAAKQMTENDFKVTTNVVNTWRQGQKQFMQYDVMITNQTEYDKKEWHISIPFEKKVSFVNGWNGHFTENQYQIDISNMDYNAFIAKNKSISGIGLIVCMDI